MVTFWGFIKFITMVGLGAITVSAIAFKDFRALLIDGGRKLFFDDVSKTPKGAKAMYAAMIEETRRHYDAASDTARKLNGQVAATRKALAAAQQSKDDAEERARFYFARGDQENARLMAEKRTAAMDDITFQEAKLGELEPMAAEATEAMRTYEGKINELERESKRQVSRLEQAQVMETLYTDLDRLRADNHIERLRSSVTESADAAVARAAGSRDAHNAKLGTKLQRLESQQSGYTTESFLAQLAQESSTQK